MDLGAGIMGLGAAILRLLAQFAALALLVGLGWKLLVIVAHGGDERTIRKEALGMVTMGVAFCALVSLAGQAGTFGVLPGPAQAVVALGQIIWNALYSAIQASAV